MITLREACWSDMELLLTWRNEAETRRYSHNTSIVAKEAHEIWLKDVLFNPERKLYIALHKKQTPVGMARADWQDDAWKLSWSISCEFRKKGLGKLMVSKLIQQLHGKYKAEIKVDNIASIKIAEAVGMHLEFEENNVLHYIFESNEKSL